MTRTPPRWDTTERPAANPLTLAREEVDRPFLSAPLEHSLRSEQLEDGRIEAQHESWQASVSAFQRLLAITEVLTSNSPKASQEVARQYRDRRAQEVGV